MTEETRDIEPYDLFASLMVWIPAIWSGLKATWRHRDWYTGRARHTMRHLGTGRGIPAADLIIYLRNSRQTPLSLRYPVVL